ncbi:MAG: ATP-dependent DNA helicase RecG [Nitrospirae bacterium]|nr:ATP-dependent DNA helicase RecG [Nitrospirota bacterium]MCL5978396.1 ATP-dependent DNA helicase RecG [Nitrospirota bacterium]
MGSDLSSPIQYVKGVGPQRARLLARLGIKTVKDALFHLPYRYEDRSSIKKIARLCPEEIQTVQGKIIKTDVITPTPKRPRLKIFEAVITDGSGALKAKWFNQIYLKRVFKTGQQVVLYGTVKINYWGSGFEIMNPEYEILDEENNTQTTDAGEQKTELGIHTGRIVPVYRLTEGLSQKNLRSIMYAVVGNSIPAISDSIPQEIIEEYGLPDIRESLRNVHFPPPASPMHDLNRGISPYHQRLSFDELFTLQLGLAAIKKREILEKGISFSPSGKLIDRLIGKLPFKLTHAQERVFNDIMIDMRSPAPMNRLIQGDVGCGKTIVALMSMLTAVECGYQSALMAPTEILAEQHYINIHRLVEDLGLKIHLLTGSKKNKEAGMIASGDADIVIGTHALIQEGVSFKNLGLIVIDEQHRFGVMQRATLRKKGTNPDTLIMTATPIPRTLALTFYGDLDYSVIDELPPNRNPVITRLFSEKNKSRIYALMEEEIKKGRQAYVVYPLIEESEKTDLKSAITGAEALQKMFPNFKIGLIHGRMKPSEREEVMREFKEGGIHILVSTTVIEVGVDVPNATVMVIIHAERFGLSQLHQLRGRVGRGSSQSYCILLSYGGSDDARKRLDVMVETTDGFRIAEEDLSIRGPGEFFGTRQSGMPDLRVANLLRDVKILEIARKEAFALIERDAALSGYPELRKAMGDFWGERLEMFKTA